MKYFTIVLSILLLTGCVIIPIPGLFNSPVKKPYYDLSYIVTDECVKDVGKIFVTDYAITFDKEDLQGIKNIMTTVIQNPPLDKGYARTINFRKKFKFMLSSTKNNLQLILIKYKEDSNGKFTRSTGFTTNASDNSGLKEYTLENCKI